MGTDKLAFNKLARNVCSKNTFLFVNGAAYLGPKHVALFIATEIVVV